MTAEIRSQEPIVIPALLIAAISVVLGLVVRFDGLGHWPLSVDEYYLAKSVLSLFDDGLPNFECGGFYGRGLLQQYVSAAILSVGGPVELGMRIYPLVCNIAALWVVFLLGFRMGGRVVGYIALALMSLSLWEIEFSRFARMYAPFQLLAVIQVYLLVRVVCDDAARMFRWMLVVLVLGVLTYEGAVFLAAPIVIALFRQPALRTGPNIGMAAVSIALALAFFMIPFRELGLSPPELPDDVLSAIQAYSGGLLLMPRLDHIAGLAASPLWLGVFSVVLLGLLLWTIRQTRAMAWIPQVAAVLSVICIVASFVLLGFVLYACALLALVGPEKRAGSTRTIFTVLLPAVAVSASLWFAFVIPGEAGNPRSLIRSFLKVPNFFEPLLYPYLAAIPGVLIAFCAVIGLFFVIMLIRRHRVDERVLLVVACVIIFLVAVALVRPNSFQTRYSFFIYPLVLCLFAYAVVSLTSIFVVSKSAAWIAPVAAVSLLILTEDADLNHYRNIDTASVNYRAEYSRALAEHYKSRYDYRSVSEYVNDHAMKGDLVMIAESTPDFYLDKVDYRYKEMTGVDFRNHLSCGLDRDVWSNAPILYKEEQVDELIRQAGSSIWVIKKEGIALGALEEFEVYRGQDGRMQVLEITRPRAR